jgi:hypothetical protein
MSSVILNHIPGIENHSYLELGVFDNQNFNAIQCRNKFSVDINGEAMYTGTTDQYFEQLEPDTKFDIIFIDANHDYDCVVRDFNNSIDHATKWIVIHDMIPPSKKFTQSKFCSDSFRLLSFLLQQTDLTIYVMNNNFGLTFVRMPAAKIAPPDHYAALSYDEFADYIATVKLYSDQEIVDILKANHV